MTAHSNLDSAVAALHSGFDICPNRFDVNNAIEQVSRACRRVVAAQTSVRNQLQGRQLLVRHRQCRSFRAIGRLARSISRSINGESGTGKELVAQALPAQSALRKSLHRSEYGSNSERFDGIGLFGHERGRLQVHQTRRVGDLNRPMAVRCFWMESVTCPPSCKPACCVCWQSKVLPGRGT